MNKGTVLILGARSDIGRAVAHRFAKAGYSIQLAARDVDTLEADRADIALRHGQRVTLHEFDALVIHSHDAFVDGLSELPSMAVCVVGLLGDQKAAEQDVAMMQRIQRSNFEGPASILSVLAERFAVRGHGVLVGISSVAGLRGRASNYIYGSAKAGFTTFLSGLRNRLAKQGVRVITVLPGFVATQMTAGLDLPPRLTARPEEVASAIERAVHRDKDLIFVRPIWRAIMGVICMMPECIFKKTNL